MQQQRNVRLLRMFSWFYSNRIQNSLNYLSRNSQPTYVTSLHRAILFILQNSFAIRMNSNTLFQAVNRQTYQWRPLRNLPPRIQTIARSLFLSVSPFRQMVGQQADLKIRPLNLPFTAFQISNSVTSSHLTLYTVCSETMTVSLRNCKLCILQSKTLLLYYNS